MLVLVLLIVAAVIFGLLGLVGFYRTREGGWEPNIAYIAAALVAIALAVWHSQG